MAVPAVRTGCFDALADGLGVGVRAGGTVTAGSSAQVTIGAESVDSSVGVMVNCARSRAFISLANSGVAARPALLDVWILPVIHARSLAKSSFCRARRRTA